MQQAVAESLRLFVALWPDARARELAAAQREYVDGQRVAAANLHVTLAFLGAWPQARLAELEAALGAVRGEPFALAFDRREITRRGVAWLSMSSTPRALLDLQGEVVGACRQVGYEPERRAYRPHLTLARRASTAAATEIDPVRWEAREFALVRSQGGRYETLHSWPLSRSRE